MAYGGGGALTAHAETAQELSLSVVTKAKNKKARYLFSSGLFIANKACLVGPAGVEPTTNGLKVRCSTN
jgi:hypothetical protein